MPYTREVDYEWLNKTVTPVIYHAHGPEYRVQS